MGALVHAILDFITWVIFLIALLMTYLGFAGTVTDPSSLAFFGTGVLATVTFIAGRGLQPHLSKVIHRPPRALVILCWIIFGFFGLLSGLGGIMLLSDFDHKALMAVIFFGEIFLTAAFINRRQISLSLCASPPSLEQSGDISNSRQAEEQATSSDQSETPDQKKSEIKQRRGTPRQWVYILASLAAVSIVLFILLSLESENTSPPPLSEPIERSTLLSSTFSGPWGNYTGPQLTPSHTVSSIENITETYPRHSLTIQIPQNFTLEEIEFNARAAIDRFIEDNERRDSHLEVKIYFQGDNHRGASSDSSFSMPRHIFRYSPNGIWNEPPSAANFIVTHHRDNSHEWERHEESLAQRLIEQGAARVAEIRSPDVTAPDQSLGSIEEPPTSAPLPVSLQAVADPWAGFTGAQGQYRPTYRIVNLDNISIGDSTRYSARIVIRSGFSGTEIEFNARHAIESILRDNTNASHINVFVHFEGDSTDGTQIARHVFHLAPGGNWNDEPGSAPLTVAHINQTEEFNRLQRIEASRRSQIQSLFAQPAPPPRPAPSRRGTSNGITSYSPTLPSSGVVGNDSSNIYHTPRCSSARQMNPSNVVRFSSASAARSAGYRPCRRCH